MCRRLYIFGMCHNYVFYASVTSLFNICYYCHELFLLWGY